MLKNIVKKYWIVVLFAISLYFVLQSLTVSGFFPIHDDEQVGRLHEIDVAVRSLHIPPRIAQNLGFGYHYPLFNFYPSFVYYVAEAFKLIGFSYISSIELMIALGFISCAASMYLFTREFFGKVGSLVSAILYTYAPYHAVDVYVRGALPEFWSFTFIPLIFWSYTRLHKTGEVKYALIAALCNALLVITHNLVALMSVVFVGLYILFLFLQQVRRKRFLTHVAISGIFSILIPAYFWIPAVFEKKYTMVELLTTELAHYSQHFVYIRQLWNSPWGYGGSLYGLYDGLSFQIGKLHIILVFAACLLWLYGYLREKNKQGVILLFILFFFLAAFLTTNHAKPVWDALSPLWYIQFPWRFLLFTAFTSSFISASIFDTLQKKAKVIAGFIVVVSVIVLYKDYFQPSAYLVNAKDENYVATDVLRWKTSKMAFEYVPKGIVTSRSDLGTTVVDISEKEIAKGDFSEASNGVSVLALENKPHKKLYKITAKEQGTIRFNIFSFPGWKVFINGKETTYTDNNKLRLITVNIPHGESLVSVRFTDTLYRSIGNWLSLLSFFTLLSILGRIYIQKKR